jgi:VCBS repeat-containing protein
VREQKSARRRFAALAVAIGFLLVAGQEVAWAAAFDAASCTEIVVVNGVPRRLATRISEDANPPTVAGQLSGGPFTSQSRTDDDDYGWFSITSLGAWTYELNSAHPKVQGLGGLETRCRGFAVEPSGGGASRTVYIEISGAFDPKPAKPQNFAVTPGHRQVRLSWDDLNDASVVRWEYRQKQGAGLWGSWQVIPNSAGRMTSYTVKGITNGVVYRFQVRAYNKQEPARGDFIDPTTLRGGYGPASDDASTQPVPDTVAPTVTFSPADGAKTAVVTTNVTVTFSKAVRNADGSDLTGGNAHLVVELKMRRCGMRTGRI